MTNPKVVVIENLCVTHKPDDIEVFEAKDQPDFVLDILRCPACWFSAEADLLRLCRDLDMPDELITEMLSDVL